MAQTRGSYRSRRYDAQPRATGQPPWLWLTTGLLVGFFLGLLYAGQIAPPGGNDSPPPTPETVSGSGSGNAASPATSSRAGEGETREADDAGTPEAGGPRFEFYEVLPNGELPRQEPALADHQPEADPPPAASTVPLPSGRPPVAGAVADPESAPPAGGVMLQVASFQNPRDADELKANLALIGLRAVVRQARINGTNWYRVRLGPFTSPEEVNQTQAHLKRNGLESIVVRY